MKEKLLGKSLDDLKQICSIEGLPSFAAGQLANWLYLKKVDKIDDMTNISKPHRVALSEKYIIGKESPLSVALSSDGTKKYLFNCSDYITCGKNGVSVYVSGKKSLSKAEDSSHFIESVMIPDDDRFTLCVSSQAGCRMGCKFCMTGRHGFHGNLSAAEIINQFFSIAESQQLTNAVFMGMGEPLDNFKELFKAIEILTAPWGCSWSPKRITVSTIGINVKELLDRTKVHLAVSLHNPFHNERLEIMPSEHVHPFEKTLQLIKQYDFTGQRRVSFEYIVFKGLNDSKKHADAIVKLLKGLECRVNLIRFHDIGDTTFVSSPMAVIEQFKQRLQSGGITTTIRASRGEDIEAACGMLAGKR